MTEGLFVACQDGTLVQYVLEPRPKAVASADKVSEDMPLDLGIVGQLQWALSRSVALLFKKKILNVFLLSQLDFFHGIFWLFSLGKTNCDRGLLPSIKCMLFFNFFFIVFPQSTEHRHGL